MPVDITMPALSPTMETGTLSKWLVKVGDAVKSGDVLAEIETDKATMEAEIIDLRTLRPMDTATVLASLKKTNRTVVEEGWPTCSISSEIIAVAMAEGFDDLDAPVLRVTNKDAPLPYAANLEKLALLKAEDVMSAVKKVCYR